MHGLYAAGLAQRAQAHCTRAACMQRSFWRTTWFDFCIAQGTGRIWFDFYIARGNGKSASRGVYLFSGRARADVRSPYVSYPCTCTYTPIPVCGEICVWRTYCFSVKCLRICDLNDLISSLSAEHVGFCGLFFLSGFGHLPTRLCCLMINSMIFLHMTIVLNFCKLFKILVFF